MRFSAGALVAIVGLVSVFASSGAADAQPALEPGLWRISVTSTTNGKPDPNQDSKECLGDELKDLASYFAPELEGAKATCKRTRQPAADRKTGYRMQCSGAGFTVDALTSVTIENSRHFTMSIRTDSRAPGESAIVVVKGEGRRIGACEPAGK
ncbi:MAG: DUF3617 domain-containing protein [Candidatus Binatia bacterium]